MAKTNFAVNDPLSNKLWAKKLFAEALKATRFSQFVGDGSSSLVQRKDETSKAAGDKITVGLRMQLTGEGIQGDQVLEGNEESLVTYSDSVLLDQLRHAVRTAGEMSQQRVPFSVRAESMSGLRDWWAGRLDECFFNQLAGNTAYSSSQTTRTGNNATIAPSTTRIVVANNNDAEVSLTTTAVLKLTDIDRLVTKAKTATPLIRPIRTDGEDLYVMFIHPQTSYQLRRDASTAGNFIDIQKAAMQGGKISDNPIFTGASWMYNNVVVHESVRVPLVPSQTAYYRNIFCGAQAMLLAFGQRKGGDAEGPSSWDEESFDYGNQLGVGGSMIFGMKKTVFNSVDFATIVCSSYSPTV